MLDRLPTELISLVIDATSACVWQRKDTIDCLSSVSTTYRFVLRPLRESIVHVPRAAVISRLESWPMATREAVVTVLIGTSDWHKDIEPFDLRDYSRLLANLPNVKHVYLQRVQGSRQFRQSNLSQQPHPRRMWFDSNSSNPFRRALITLASDPRRAHMY